MKKVLFFLITLFLLVGCSHDNNVVNNKLVDNKLNGKLYDNGIYEYKINNGFNKDNSSSILNNNVIYNLKNGDNVTLTINDIFKNNPRIINNSLGYTYCGLYSNKIECYPEEDYVGPDVFDLNFNKIDKYSNKENHYVDLNYLINIKDDGIFVNDKIVFDTKNEYKDYYVVEARMFNNNLIVLLGSEVEYDPNVKYLYNDKTKKLDKIEYQDYQVYEQGIIFKDIEKGFLIYNFVSDEVNSYNKNLKEDIGFNDFIINSNGSKIAYIFNNELIIETLGKNEIITIDIFKYVDLVQIINMENDLILINGLNKESNEFNNYIVDVSEYKNNVINYDDYINSIEEINDNIINKIKEELNVNVLIKEKTNIKFTGFTALSCDDKIVLNNALNKLYNSYKQFNKKVFDKFYDGYDGLNVYLVGKINPCNEYDTIDDVGAYTYYEDKVFVIAADSNNINLSSILLHELHHALEFRAEKDINIYLDWNSYNPKKFKYVNKYSSYSNGYSNSDYLIYLDDDKTNAYFFDTYSKIMEVEDKAVVFQHICSLDLNEDYKEYPNLYKKAKYLAEELSKYYPELKESSCIKRTLNN